MIPLSKVLQRVFFFSFRNMTQALLSEFITVIKWVCAHGVTFYPLTQPLFHDNRAVKQTSCVYLVCL